MNIYKNRTLLRVFLLLILLVCFGLVLTQPSQAQSEEFFTEVTPRADTQLQEANPKIIRTRYVRPDLVQLAELGQQRSGRITLNLFEDASFEGLLQETYQNPSGSTSWYGTLENVQFGTFTLVTRGDEMIGTIKMPGAFFRITSLADGILAIHEMNEAAFPPEFGGHDHPAETPASPDQTASSSPSADDGSIIDVLVVYSLEARQTNPYGSTTTNMNTLIDLALTETNAAYANSNINQRLQVVHTEEISFNENFSTTDWWEDTLNLVTNTSDGTMDNVHTIRDNYCADEVVLLVGRDDYCGIAWVSSDASNSFAVVSVDCATGYYSFGHELAHNMGGYHDWYVDSTNSYAHGYINPADQWRTIMAYNTECGIISPCNRLQYFSNPAITYGGDPLGIPNGTSRSCNTGVSYPYASDCDADVHTMLNSTAVTVAQFRDSAVCSPATYDISGYVLDSDNSGISGISVEFDGPSAPASVTTNASGYYSQSGFSNATYTVTFATPGYLFSPRETSFSMNGTNQTQNTTAYPAVSLPHSEGFESGALSTSWTTLVVVQGRVRIDSTYPHSGSYALLLDENSNDGNYSQSSATLVVDLSDVTQADLTFWWREFLDENHVSDGVFISDDDGATWYWAYSFNDGPEYYIQTTLDLDEAASAAGMSFNDHFLIKFQFYDNANIPYDGYAIDDISISAPIEYDGHTINDNMVNDSYGDDDGIAECGEIIELYVNLLNRGAATVNGVTATISSSDPYVSFPANTVANYGSILSGGTATNAYTQDDYEVSIAASAPNGHVVPFTLNITADAGGPWTDTFSIILGCDYTIFLPLIMR